MRLDDALTQIADIRRQVARTGTFSGFRWAVTLFSAAVAVATALIQPILIPVPADGADRYFILWFSAGAVCLAVVVVATLLRCRRTGSPLQRELAVQVVRQFVPSLVMGGLVTFVLGEFAWSSIWIAPGFWAIFVGMGVLACRPLLPRGTGLVGVFYLMAGLLSIAFSGRFGPFSPWIMGIPFGVGQTAAAAVLYFGLERDHAPV